MILTGINSRPLIIVIIILWTLSSLIVIHQKVLPERLVQMQSDWQNGERTISYHILDFMILYVHSIRVLGSFIFQICHTIGSHWCFTQFSDKMLLYKMSPILVFS